VAVQIQLRRDTEANWTSENPVLAVAELAVSTDTKKIKIGDGVSSWGDLVYVNALPSEVSSAVGNLDTDDIDEGSANLYFTATRAQEATPGRVVASATKPSSPSVGDGWLDTEDGVFYVYMSDVDTSQWIEV
jgi:hypothetical protein